MYIPTLHAYLHTSLYSACVPPYPTNIPTQVYIPTPCIPPYPTPYTLYPTQVYIPTLHAYLHTSLPYTLYPIPTQVYIPTLHAYLHTSLPYTPIPHTHSGIHTHPACIPAYLPTLHPIPHTHSCISTLPNLHPIPIPTHTHPYTHLSTIVTPLTGELVKDLATSTDQTSSSKALEKADQYIKKESKRTTTTSVDRTIVNTSTTPHSSTEGGVGAGGEEGSTQTAFLRSLEEDARERGERRREREVRGKEAKRKGIKAFRESNFEQQWIVSHRQSRKCLGTLPSIPTEQP